MLVRVQMGKIGKLFVYMGLGCGVWRRRCLVRRERRCLVRRERSRG
jgi:hypothetical protein